MILKKRIKAKTAEFKKDVENLYKNRDKSLRDELEGKKAVDKNYKEIMKAHNEEIAEEKKKAKEKEAKEKAEKEK